MSQRLLDKTQTQLQTFTTSTFFPPHSPKSQMVWSYSLMSRCPKYMHLRSIFAGEWEVFKEHCSLSAQMPGKPSRLWFLPRTWKTSTGLNKGWLGHQALDRHPSTGHLVK